MNKVPKNKKRLIKKYVKILSEPISDKEKIEKLINLSNYSITASKDEKLELNI